MIVVIRNSVGMFMLKTDGVTTSAMALKLLRCANLASVVGWEVIGTKADNVMLPIELLLQSSFTMEPEKNRGNFYPHVQS